MRLLLATSEFLPFRGGIGTYAFELASAAAMIGHEVVVLAPDYGANQRAADARLPFEVIRYGGRRATMKGLPRRVAILLRAATGRRFDVIHAIDWPFFIPARIASAVLSHTRFVLTVHGSEIAYMRAPRRRRALDLLRFWSPGWARWIANSDYTRRFLIDSFPAIRASDTLALPLAVSADFLAQRRERAPARAAFDVADTDIVILSLGRVVPRKGHRVIADALARIGPDLAARLQWWIVGPLLDAGHATALREAAATLPIRTTFFGALPQDDVRTRIAAADIFCLPGYRDDDGDVEGFGLVFLEAGASAVPSVSTFSGGIPEAIEHGVTGLLVPERNAAALADQLVRLASDDELRRDMGVRARQKAEAIGWDDIARNTYAIAAGTAFSPDTKDAA